MVDISVGPYTLTGGELPAMILIDSITRRIPGALGHDSSIEELRVASPTCIPGLNHSNIKDKTYRVPKILLRPSRQDGCVEIGKEKIVRHIFSLL